MILFSRARILISAQFIALSLSNGFAAEIRIGVAIEPVNEKIQLPLAVLQSQDLKIEKISEGRWSYVLANEDKLIGSLSASISAVPDSYSFLPVDISLPYEYKVLPIELFAVNVVETGSTIGDLYGTRVTSGMNTVSLFEFYQRAAFLAKPRLNSIKTTGRPIFGHDAQVFFKFLEASRELGWKLNVKPSKLALDVTSLLEARMSEKQGRDRKVIVRATGGKSDMEQLLTQIGYIQAEHYRKIWLGILAKKREKIEIADLCKLYRAFRDTLLAEVDPITRGRWDVSKDYQMLALVTNAMTECITRSAEAAIRDKGVIDDNAKTEILNYVNPADKRDVQEGAAAPVRDARMLQMQVLRKFDIL